MNRKYSSFRYICRDHLTEEKIMIVPDYFQGQELIQSAVKKVISFETLDIPEEGIPLLNFKIDTLKELARKKCGDYLYEKNLEIIDNTTSSILIENIMNRLTREGRLNYFNSLEISQGIINAVNNTINDYRMAGLSVSDISLEAFVNIEKCRDFKKILQGYEKSLEKNNYVDQASLLKTAIKQDYSNFTDRLYIYPINMKLSYLENKLLELLAYNDLYILIPVQIRRAEPSFSYIFDGPPEVTEDFKLRCSTNDKESYPRGSRYFIIDIQKAYGESNEVRGIFRKIKTKNITFDNVNIFYTVKKPYCQLIYELSQKFNIPVTFGEGISIKNTKPARLYFSLLDWIDDNYSVATLKKILSGGIFKINDDSAPSLNKIINTFREIGIGWGKARYLKILNKEIDNLKLKKEKSNKNAQDYYHNKIKDLQWCRNFIKKLFDWLPESVDGLINIDKLTDSLIKILKNHSNISCEQDSEARELILDVLEKTAKNYKSRSELRGILKHLKNAVSALSVNASISKPGSIHVTSYKKAVWSLRDHNFLIGLDESKFPGQIKEDPILLDDERIRLSPRLDIYRNKNREKLRKLDKLLASIRCHLYLSYSCYDTIENREIAPAPVLTEIFRVHQRDMSLDFNDLNNFIENTSTFIPEDKNEVLDENELWLHLNKYKGIININNTFNKLYKDVAKGIKAINKRKMGFNKYNGCIDIDSSAVDFRENSKIVSATKLEQIARCPYSYFIEHILKINVPEDISYDPESWLDPLARGSLLHKIYELFYRKITECGDKAVYSEHIELLYEIAEREINKQKNKLLPPNEIVYKREFNKILKSCQVFLKSEENYQETATPSYFEFVFGYSTDNSEQKEYKPVEINLPSGSSIKVGGKIDRIDKVKDNIYNIIDYKTGSTYSYSNSDYFKNGKQLQHALYALAFENIMGDSVSVDKAGYIFPSLKGEGQRFMKTAEGIDTRENVKEIIDILLDIIANGNFAMARYDYNNKPCNFCDYNIICDRERHDYINDLRNDSNITEFDKLRRLNGYA